MTITDSNVLKLLNKANSEVLNEYVDGYPEDEIDGQTDLDIFIGELDYLLWMYEEDDTIFSENLKLSQQIMKETDNGAKMPVVLPEFKFKYTKQEVEDAKTTVAEYNRLKKIRREILK